MYLYNILDYSNVVIQTIQAPSAVAAYLFASQNLSHYFNYYVVEAK